VPERRGVPNHSRLQESVGELVVFSVPLCILCVSVVKILRKTFTTEALRSHRDTENDSFSDRPLKSGVNETGLVRKDRQPSPNDTLCKARSGGSQ
jgi:hypothetical protein